MKIFNIPAPTIIGDPCETPIDPSSMLTVNSVDKGVLLPRMTTAEMNAIVDPANGLIVYNTDLSQLSVFTGAAWEPVAAGGGGSSN